MGCSFITQITLESEEGDIVFDVYGDSQATAAWVTSIAVAGVPPLYKERVIHSCVITTGGVEEAVALGLSTLRFKEILALGLPVRLQFYVLSPGMYIPFVLHSLFSPSLTLNLICFLVLRKDEQTAIRQGLDNLPEGEVGYIHLEKCAVPGDRGTSNLIRTEHKADSYKENLALCIEGFKDKDLPDLSVLAVGVSHGLYHSLTLVAQKIDSKRIIELATACNKIGWSVQVGLGAAQHKWQQGVLQLDGIVTSDGDVVDAPWLIKQGINRVHQMELIFDAKAVSPYFPHFWKRIETGELRSLYLRNHRIPVEAIHHLVQLVEVAAAQGMAVKVGKWCGVEYGDGWLVLDNAQVYKLHL